MRIVDMPEFRDKTQVTTFDQATPVCDAIDDMAKHNYGAVLVTSKKKLVGIFTERDLLARVVGQGRDVENTKISDVMSINIETAKPSDSVALCMGRMDHGGFRHMPVTDSDNKLVGMLSQRDFIAYTMDRLKDRVT